MLLAGGTAWVFTGDTQNGTLDMDQMYQQQWIGIFMWVWKDG